MSVSTHGWRLDAPSHALRAAVELVSSMRFSISLLTVICIASIIGSATRSSPLSGRLELYASTKRRVTSGRVVSEPRLSGEWQARLADWGVALTMAEAG